MKTITVNLFLCLFLSMIFSCSDKDNTTDNQEEFKLDNLDLELSFDLKDYQDVYFSTSNLELFTEKFGDDLLSKGAFYFSINKDFTVVRISSDSYENKLLKINEGLEAKSSKTCKTCRSEKCAKETIKKAAGDGTKTVYISIKPVKTFGVQTGVEIFYSPNPIVSQVVPLPTITIEDRVELGERGDIINIDSLL